MVAMCLLRTVRHSKLFRQEQGTAFTLVRCLCARGAHLSDPSGSGRVYAACLICATTYQKSLSDILFNCLIISSRSLEFFYFEVRQAGEMVFHDLYMPRGRRR